MQGSNSKEAQYHVIFKEILAWRYIYSSVAHGTITDRRKLHVYFRVATAQGKQGIWFLLFPDRENTGNFFFNTGKVFETQGKYFWLYSLM